MPLAHMFSTPIALYEPTGMEMINNQIANILIEESLNKPSVAVSNVGGWHSQYNLQSRPEACFRQLSEYIIACAQDLSEVLAKSSGRSLPTFKAKAEMWAMVMRHSNYTIPHTHSDWHWAAVYYADAGEAIGSEHPKSGVITFTDPRMGVLPIPGLEMGVANFEVVAKTGQLLLFPGWLTHYVHAYYGMRPRVSVACNVHLQV